MFAFIDGPFPFWQVLFFSLGFGFLAGLWYECLRIVRTAVKTVYRPTKRAGRILLGVLDFILDLVYFLVLSVAAVLSMFVCNRGQLRLSMLLAAGVGLYLYFVTIGRMIVCIHRAILRWIYRFLCLIYRYTLRYVFWFLRWIYRKTLWVLWEWLAEKISVLYEKFESNRAKRCMTRLVRACEDGFAGYEDYISIV